MPINGRVVEWDAIEWKVASNASISGSGAGTATGSHTATGTTNFIPNAVNVSNGIVLTAGSTTNSWTVSYEGPGGPFSTGGSGYRTNVSISAVAKNVKLYSKLTGSLWRLVWSEVDIYVNGSFHSTLSNSDIDETSAGVGPNYIPLIGMPLKISGSCSAGRNVEMPVFDYCNPDSYVIAYETIVEGKASGGWRFKENGTWYAPPVLPYIENPGSSGVCPFGLDISGVVSASNTFDAEIETKSRVLFERTRLDDEECIAKTTAFSIPTNPDDAPEEEEFFTSAACLNPCTNTYGPLWTRKYQTVSESEAKSGHIRLVPNLERAVRKLGDSYRSFWFRGTFPSVSASISRSCTDGVLSANISDTPTLYPSVSDFLGVVGSSAHPIEDVFIPDIYSPTQASWSKSRTTSTTSFIHGGPCLCPPPGVPGGYSSYLCDIICPPDTSHTIAESANCLFPLNVGSGGGYQSHDNPEARYLATWPNPHWQFFVWREDWSNLSWNGYWGLIRQQWLFNPLLPANEKLEKRNFNILAPFWNDNGHQPFLNQYTNGMPWVGAHRWKTDALTIPETFSLSNSVRGKWSSDDATLSFGSDITLSFSSSTATVDLDLADFSTAPYFRMLLAKRVNLSFTNCTAVVKLVHADGTEQVLPPPYDLVSSAEKYAGDWPIEGGTDVLPGGDSSSAVSPERNVAFQLGLGSNAAKLRFVITPTGSPVKMDYPEFVLNKEHPALYSLSAKVQLLLWPEAFSLRIGNWSWADGNSVRTIPLVSDNSGPNTIIDWLCTRRVLFEGIAPDSGLTTEISSLFDSYEGQSISQTDKDGRAVILPKGSGDTIRAAIVNSYSEVPPLAAFPFKKRNEDNWLPTGLHAQVVYDWTQLDRYLISRVSLPSLKTSTNAVSGQIMTGLPSGFNGWVFSPAVNNAESYWKIFSGDDHLASSLPYYGYFFVHELYESELDDLDIFHWLDESVYIAYVDGGKVYVQSSQHSSGHFGWEGPIEVAEGSQPSLLFNPFGYVELFYNDSGSIKRTWSTDRGLNWKSNPQIMFTGMHRPRSAVHANGLSVVAAFKYNSGNSGPGKIYLRVKGPGDLTYGQEKTAKDTNGNDLVIEEQNMYDISISYDIGRIFILAKINGEQDKSLWFSTDWGDRFKRVS